MVKLTKEKPAEKTSGDISNSGMMLLGFVERVERLDEEADGIKDDRKEVLDEAKANGFDSAILRRVIAIRKMDAGDYAETEDLIDTYLRAVRDAEKAQTAASTAEAE